jgi:hypothetical protein
MEPDMDRHVELEQRERRANRANRVGALAVAIGLVTVACTPGTVEGSDATPADRFSDGGITCRRLARDWT